jgi:hypothetical protein
MHATTGLLLFALGLLLVMAFDQLISRFMRKTAHAA